MSAATKPRSSWVRLAAAIVISVLVCGLSTAAVLAAVVYRAGTIDVEISEAGGEHISIAVPSTLVSAAVKFVPSHLYIDAAEEVGPYWEACRTAVREIAKAPDGVFVQVDGADLEVRVAKRDGILHVDVLEHGDQVRVSVPIDTVLEIVEKIESVL